MSSKCNVSCIFLIKNLLICLVHWLENRLDALNAKLEARIQAQLREQAVYQAPPPVPPASLAPAPYPQALHDSIAPMHGEGFVYLVYGESGLYKIGCTARLNNRVKQIGYETAQSVQLIHVIPAEDMLTCEKYLHDLYAPFRIRGEWFSLSPAQVGEIKAIGRLVLLDEEDAK